MYYNKTYEYLSKLIDQVKKDKQVLHDKIFIHSHPNLVPGDYAANRKELERYRKFHESGFDSSEAIKEMCKLDTVVSDLSIILFRFDNNNK